MVHDEKKKENDLFYVALHPRVLTPRSNLSARRRRKNLITSSQQLNIQCRELILYIIQKILEPLKLPCSSVPLYLLVPKANLSFVNSSPLPSGFAGSTFRNFIQFYEANYDKNVLFGFVFPVYLK